MRDVCRNNAQSLLIPLASVWLIVCAGCGEAPEAGSAAGQLATLYSDSTRWCSKQRECNVRAGECAVRWPDRESAQAAVAKLSTLDAKKCLGATLALDACALKLPCDEFAVFYSLEYCDRDGKLVPCCTDENGAEVECPGAKCAREELDFVEQCDALERHIGK